MRRSSCPGAAAGYRNNAANKMHSSHSVNKTFSTIVLLAKVCSLGFFLIVGHKLVCARTADLALFAFVKQRCGTITGTPADEARSMGFGDGGVFVRAVERPVHRVGRDAMEVAFLTEVTFVFDEEPDLAVKNVIDLLGFVLVRLGMIAGSSSRDHQAALIAVAFTHNHRTGAGFASLISLVLRDIGAFCLSRHKVASVRTEW